MMTIRGDSAVLLMRAYHSSRTILETASPRWHAREEMPDTVAFPLVTCHFSAPLLGLVTEAGNPSLAIPVQKRMLRGLQTPIASLQCRPIVPHPID